MQSGLHVLVFVKVILVQAPGVKSEMFLELNSGAELSGSLTAQCGAG